MPLSPLLPVAEIHERLQGIFPEGTANRNYVTREIAAKTVFVMLYVGAIEGAECWLRPDQVTRMTDAQAASTDDDSRTAWLEESMQPSSDYIMGRWYAANTREPIRDETLREGLVREVKTWEQGMPRPLLLELHPDSDFSDLTYLVRQAFHFSFMSWRSFFPSHEPVTILYSRWIANMLGNLRAVPDWDGTALNLMRDRRAMWFL